MSAANIFQLRYCPPAPFCALRTAWSERTAALKTQRTRWLPFQQTDFCGLITIYVKYRIQQRPGIRMAVLLLQQTARHEFHHAAKIHYGHTVGNAAHERRIVADEKAADVSFFNQSD